MELTANFSLFYLFRWKLPELFFYKKNCAFPKNWARNVPRPAKVVKGVLEIARKMSMKNSFGEWQFSTLAQTKFNEDSFQSFQTLGFLRTSSKPIGPKIL